MYKFLLTMGMVISSIILVSGQSIPSYIPSSGLVGWWPFNGNANDESGNNNHGIVDGAKLSIDRFGRDLYCYKFNNNDITFPISNRQFINDFTISLWVKFENHVNEYPTFLWLENAGLVIQGEVLKDTTGFSCYFLDNFRIGGLQKEDGHVNAPSPLKQWNHIVLVNLNGINYLYINNILRATSNSKSILQGKQAANFLRLGKGFLSPLEDFNGLLDDLGIWNRALSPEEVQRIFSYQPTVTPVVELVHLREVSVFPNPTDDLLTIKISAAELKTISFQVLDNAGKKIKSGIFQAPQTDISLRGLPIGTYHILLKTKQELRAFKVIKL